MRRHLLVTNDFPPKVGGIQAYLWELWRGLEPDSFVVLTASSDPGAAVFDTEQGAAGFRIERVRGRILYLPTPALRARIRALADEVGASLVVFDPVLPLGMLGPALGIPYGVVLHGAEVAIPGRLPATRQALSYVLARAALVVSAGRYPDAQADRALRAGPPGAIRSRWAAAPVGDPFRSQVRVQVPPGVDPTRFRPLDAAGRARVRRKLGVARGAPLVSSVSRLVPRKGMDVVIEAARRLAPSFPELTVLIGGTGRDASRLAAQGRRTLAPVRFLGRIPEEDKAELLGASDVFAMACRDRWGGLEREGFGIVFVEAAAAGTPQVAGDSGGAAEAVVDGVTGLVVRRSRDPGEVAGAIRRLLVDEGLRRRLAEAGRRRAELELSQSVLVAKLAAALEEVQG